VTSEWVPGPAGEREIWTQVDLVFQDCLLEDRLEAHVSTNVVWTTSIDKLTIHLKLLRWGRAVAPRTKNGWRGLGHVHEQHKGEYYTPYTPIF